MIIKELRKVKCGKIIEKADLKKYTTYKAGGYAAALVFPKNITELENLLKVIKKIILNIRLSVMVLILYSLMVFMMAF